MRRPRLRRWLLRIAGVCLALFIYIAWPGRSTLTISEETTFVTGPLDEHGFVDYPTALNERLSKGITPENNANVLIWRALGPHPEKGTMPPRYFQWLGIESPPEQGDYFVSWEDYFEANLKIAPDDILELYPQGNDWKEFWNKRIHKTTAWPWASAELPELARWLKRNEKALALTAEASKKTQYYNPLVPRSTDPGSQRLISSLLPQVQKGRGLARAMTTRAMQHLANGKYGEAWADLLVVQRLGRLLANGATLIEHLVGIAVVAISSNAMATFVGHAKLTSNEWLERLDELKKLPALPSLELKLKLGERFMTLDSLTSIVCYGTQNLDRGREEFFASPSPNGWLDSLFTNNIHWDQGFRNVNSIFDRLTAASRLPDRAGRKQEFRNVFAEVVGVQGQAFEMSYLEKNFLSKDRRGELVTSIMLGWMLRGVETVQNAWERINQIQSNLQVAVALAAYRADHARFPDRLESLSPNYLDKIPGDIFSGKPLIYRPTEEGYLLYSVGVNEIDEGGHWTDDEPRGDDPRIRMPLREPRDSGR